MERERLQASEQRGNRGRGDRLELVKKKQIQASEQRGNKYSSEYSNITRAPLAYADLFKVEELGKERN